VSHGDRSCYVHGCRRLECVKANADYVRERRRRFRDDGRPIPDRVKHGLAATYVNYGCKCGPCTEANSRKSAEQYRRSRG
jgi:hypothetical protein